MAKRYAYPIYNFKFDEKRIQKTKKDSLIHKKISLKVMDRIEKNTSLLLFYYNQASISLYVLYFVSKKIKKLNAKTTTYHVSWYWI